MGLVVIMGIVGNFLDMFWKFVGNLYDAGVILAQIKVLGIIG